MTEVPCAPLPPSPGESFVPRMWHAPPYAARPRGRQSSPTRARHLAVRRQPDSPLSRAPRVPGGGKASPASADAPRNRHVTVAGPTIPDARELHHLPPTVRSRIGPGAATRATRPSRVAPCLLHPALSSAVPSHSSHPAVSAPWRARPSIRASVVFRPRALRGRPSEMPAVSPGNCVVGSERRRGRAAPSPPLRRVGQPAFTECGWPPSRRPRTSAPEPSKAPSTRPGRMPLDGTVRGVGVAPPRGASNHVRAAPFQVQPSSRPPPKRTHHQYGAPAPASLRPPSRAWSPQTAFRPRCVAKPRCSPSVIVRNVSFIFMHALHAGGGRGRTGSKPLLPRHASGGPVRETQAHRPSRRPSDPDARAPAQAPLFPAVKPV